jgi:lactobin A/cerein 7B family class IIb bacteriocin
MIASYGETSGFSPVTGEELGKVNGGFWPELIFTVVGVAAATIIAVSGGSAIQTSRNSK